jgi:ABC-type glycerol-3-phosphate transport system substrate-binding protein
MVIPRRRTTAFAALLLALGLTGCSSSADKGGGSSPGSSPAVGSAGAADPKTKQDVTTAFSAFFNSNTTPAQSELALQHGTEFRDTLAKESTGSNSQDSGVKVTGVSLSGKDVAAVTFTLLQAGKTLLPNVQGFAVREDGTWKVAAQTFCNLLKLEGTAPAVCDDTSITALPN